MASPNPYYRSGAKLQAKNELAGGVAVAFPEFALATVALDRVRTALDVGCGWGRFARPLLHKAPELDLICCDVWPGMIESCRANLTEVGLHARFVVSDARGLPFGEATADLVMANHMLYEFPSDELERVIGELARVLRRDGILLATTYSAAHPIPMTELHHATLAVLGVPDEPPRPLTFSLENGAALLQPQFETVATRVLEDVRSITDAHAFTELYLRTGAFDGVSNDETVPEGVRRRIPETFRSLAQEQIETHGSITTVTKWTAFVASGRR